MCLLFDASLSLAIGVIGVSEMPGMLVSSPLYSRAQPCTCTCKKDARGTADICYALTGTGYLAIINRVN
jgi:hypothetical protein